ncbi:TIGR04219 family outer membrane beta-barrel protein [Ectothiorhodospiraceae bacterium 2226]|nr:TIGR04219 family outer membrane beta-barrel protein [Ectothiorhodospiraceae bacterium 2226]
MKPRTIAYAAAGLLMTPAAHADFLGFGAGAALWQHTPSGSVQYRGDEIDMRDSGNGLGLDRDRDAMIWAHLEHPVPLLPNVRLMHTSVSNAGSGTLNHSFGSFNFSEAVDSSMDLRQLDAVLYWELLDNWVELDLGLQVKALDGEIEVRGRTSGRQERAEFSGVLPMGYARAAFHLPLSGFAVELAGAGISYDGHRLTDLMAQVSYRSSFGLGVVAGWREQRLKLDDLDDVTADVTIDGPYAGLFYRF